MKKVKLGVWEFEVDLEKTKAYYQKFAILEPDTQCSRNYQEYCKRLSEQEQDFFDAFGIDPKSCNVDTIGLTGEKNYPTFGNYCFAGKFLKKPNIILMTAEEFVEKNFIHDAPDARIYTGKYQFEFMDPESPFARLPDDMPQGFICVQFFAEEMPWLLEEKCEHRMYERPKPWQLIKKVREKVFIFRDRRDAIHTLKNRLILLFGGHKISYQAMSKSEVKRYMNRWFMEIVPVHNQVRARTHCFSNRKYNCYLWHAFSFEDAPYIDGAEAKSAFDQCLRQKAVLLMDYEKVGFILDSAEGITAEELGEFRDIIITDENFNWTFVRTHEEGCGCGPYFHRRSMP